MVGLFSLVMVVSPAQAALDAYMSVTGSQQGVIEGGSTVAGREGQFQVYEVHHLMTAGSEGVDHQPLIVNLDLGKGTPRLLQAMQTDEPLDIVIDFFRPSPTGQEEQYYTLELQNARLVLAEQIQLDNKWPENMPITVWMRLRFEFEAIHHIFIDGGASEQVEL